MSTRKVVILHDAVGDDPSLDALDTIAQAEEVAAALCRSGYRCRLQPFHDEEIASLSRIAPDELVFNLVESIAGSSRLIGLVPLALEHRGLPFTGSRALALLATSDKLVTKQMLTANGIATPAWLAADGTRSRELPLPGMYIIKPVTEDASIGIDQDSVVRVAAQDELQGRLKRAARLRGLPVFAEQYIPGREFNLSLLGLHTDVVVLPPAEIDFSALPPGHHPLVDYAAKWNQDSFEYHNTPRRFDFPVTDNPLLEKIKEIAHRCWSLLWLNGYARVEFRVDDTGMPLVLEVNANPCLSSDAGLAAAAARVGLDYDAVVARVVACRYPATRVDDV